MPDWFVAALSVVRSVKSNELDLLICDALWTGETSSSRSVRRLLGPAPSDVVAGGTKFARFRFEDRGGVSDCGVGGSGFRRWRNLSRSGRVRERDGLEDGKP
jgi:hypothetical protein